MNLETLIGTIITDLENHSIDKHRAERRITACKKLLEKIRKDPNKDYTKELNTLVTKSIGIIPYSVYSNWEKGLKQCTKKK